MTDPLESLLETFSEHSASYAKEHENSEEYFNLPAALALICREILNLKKKKDKETADILNEMIKDLDRKISFPSADPRDQWPTYYDLLQILYWMKSAMSESGRESSPASGDSSQAPQSH